MKKGKKILVLCCLFLCITGFRYQEEKQRVFDYANLLTSSEVEQEEKNLKSQSKQDMVDYAFLSTKDLQGYNAKEYMDLFISQNQMGYDKSDGDAAILLIDIQKQEVWVGVNGTLEETLSETDISSIVSDILPYTQKNDFRGAIEVFAHNIHSKLEQIKERKKTVQGTTGAGAISVNEEETVGGKKESDKIYESQENLSDRKSESDEKRDGFLNNPFICLLIGAVLSGGIVVSMVLSGKSSMQSGADTYTTNAKVNPYTKEDIFLRTVTQKVKREQKNK